MQCTPKTKNKVGQVEPKHRMYARKEKDKQSSSHSFRHVFLCFWGGLTLCRKQITLFRQHCEQTGIVNPGNPPRANNTPHVLARNLIPLGSSLHSSASLAKALSLPRFVACSRSQMLHAPACRKLLETKGDTHTHTYTLG